MANGEQQNLRVVCSNLRVLLQQAVKKSGGLIEELNKLVCEALLVELQRLVELVNAKYRGVVEPPPNRCLHRGQNWFQVQGNLSENQVHYQHI